MSNSRSSRFSLLIISLTILLSVLYFAGCGDDGTTVDGDTDGDTETVSDGDTESVDGDMEASDGDLDEIVDGDTESSEDEAEVEAEEEVDIEKEDATKLRFGYAEADISPPLGTMLGGYGMPGLGRATTAIHDPIMLQVALFANDVNDAFALITVDAAGFSYDFGDYHDGIKGLRKLLAAKVKDTIDLKPTHILFSSSHSHAAPDLVGFWQLPGDGVPIEYLDDIFAKAETAIAEAAENLQDAKIYFGETVLDGYTKRDSECSEVIDNTLSIIQAKSMEDELLATIVNFAKHPTSMGNGNSEASADFIWGYREEMKNQTGAPGMFVQGFIAAVHGPHGEGETAWDRTYDMGKIIADTTIAELANMTLAEEYNINHKSKEFDCEVAGETYLTTALDYLNMPKRYYTVNEDDNYVVSFLEVSWHKVGPIEFASFPGEGTPEYSFALRERMSGQGKFIVGLGNDEVGYIVDPESLAADTTGQLAGYELLMGLGETVGPTCFTAQQELGWFGEVVEDGDVDITDGDEDTVESDEEVVDGDEEISEIENTEE